MPVAYIEKFTKLQDMMPTSSFDKIEVILKKELGKNYHLLCIYSQFWNSVTFGSPQRGKRKCKNFFYIREHIILPLLRKYL